MTNIRATFYVLNNALDKEAAIIKTDLYAIHYTKNHRYTVSVQQGITAQSRYLSLVWSPRIRHIV